MTNRFNPADRIRAWSLYLSFRGILAAHGISHLHTRMYVSSEAPEKQCRRGTSVLDLVT